MIDERMLRIYKFLIQVGRFTVAQVPEPYRTEIIDEEES